MDRNQRRVQSSGARGGRVNVTETFTYTEREITAGTGHAEPPPSYEQLERQGQSTPSAPPFTVSQEVQSAADTPPPYTSLPVNISEQSPLIRDTPAPKDYYCCAWLACLFCFFPTGLCAIWSATSSREAHLEQQPELAYSRANLTRTFLIATLVFGLGIWLAGAIILTVIMIHMYVPS